MLTPGRRIARGARCIALLLPVVAVVGCNRPLPVDPDVPTEVRIRQLVRDVDDFAHDPYELKLCVPRLFVSGCEPSETDLQRYANYSYEEKPPVWHGDTATMVVNLKDAKTGSSLGEFTWSAKKVKVVKPLFKLADDKSGAGTAAPPSDKAGSRRSGGSPPPRCRRSNGSDRTRACKFYSQPRHHMHAFSPF